MIVLRDGNSTRKYSRSTPKSRQTASLSRSSRKPRRSSLRSRSESFIQDLSDLLYCPFDSRAPVCRCPRPQFLLLVIIVFIQGVSRAPLRYCSFKTYCKWSSHRTPDARVEGWSLFAGSQRIGQKFPGARPRLLPATAVSNAT